MSSWSHKATIFLMNIYFIVQMSHISGVQQIRSNDNVIKKHNLNLGDDLTQTVQNLYLRITVMYRL